METINLINDHLLNHYVIFHVHYKIIDVIYLYQYNQVTSLIDHLRTESAKTRTSSFKQLTTQSRPQMVNYSFIAFYMSGNLRAIFGPWYVLFIVSYYMYHSGVDGPLYTIYH